MSKAFAELSPTGDKIEVHFRYDPDLVRSIKEVPGSRFVDHTNGGPMWLVPLNLDVARRLNEELGPSLVLGRALRTWGREARKREQNLQALASIDSVDAKDLVLNTKIPELTEWFRGYQRADVKFLAATSALNLNEQGLGKTTEIIGAIFEAGLENGRHLVIAPKTALETVWREEIERWTADLEKPHEVITYSGDMTKLAREAAIEEFWECVEEDWPVWFVCTPATVRDGNEPFMDPKEFPKGWTSFTIDEYHKTGLPNASGKKGTGSKFSDAVKEVKAERRYAMTGTPMGGRVIKLWGAFHFLYPDQFTSKWQWAKTWLEVNNNGYGSEIGGIQRGREEEFYRAHAPYMVRRLKSEVLPQLPPKQYVNVWCKMTSKQAKQYEQFAAKAEADIEGLQLNAIGILAEYTRLKVFADAYCDNMTERMQKCDSARARASRWRHVPQVPRLEDDQEAAPCPLHRVGQAALLAGASQRSRYRSRRHGRGCLRHRGLAVQGGRRHGARLPQPQGHPDREDHRRYQRRRARSHSASVPGRRRERTARRRHDYDGRRRRHHARPGRHGTHPRRDLGP
jgi:hypothetical protein